jgi:hypothetical protein
MAADTETNGGNNASAACVDRRLIRGSAALMIGGLLLWFTRATVGTVAVVSGCRRYVAALEEPPRETARRRWGQFRSATVAGVGAWQDDGRRARPDPDG